MSPTSSPLQFRRRTSRGQSGRQTGRQRARRRRRHHRCQRELAGAGWQRPTVSAGHGCRSRAAAGEVRQLRQKVQRLEPGRCRRRSSRFNDRWRAESVGAREPARKKRSAESSESVTPPKHPASRRRRRRKPNGARSGWSRPHQAGRRRRREGAPESGARRWRQSSTGEITGQRAPTTLQRTSRGLDGEKGGPARRHGERHQGARQGQESCRHCVQLLDETGLAQVAPNVAERDSVADDVDGSGWAATRCVAGRARRWS